MQCLECGKDLIQITGKRAKQFCNVTCRSNYWQKKKRDSEPKKQGLPGRPPKKKIDKLQEQIADAAEARNNSLINAARGRDANGVNQDESNLAEKETKITDKKKLASAIRKQPMASKECLPAPAPLDITPMTYAEYLREALITKDKDYFSHRVRNDKKLNSRQRDMIYSKLK